MAEKVTMKLQTPADGAGRRKDIHLITSSDEVIINRYSRFNDID